MNCVQMHVHICTLVRALSLGQMEHQSALNLRYSQCISTLHSSVSIVTSIADIKNIFPTSVQLQISSKYVWMDYVWSNGSAMTIKFNLIWFTAIDLKILVNHPDRQLFTSSVTVLSDCSHSVTLLLTRNPNQTALTSAIHSALGLWFTHVKPI